MKDIKDFENEIKEAANVLLINEEPIKNDINVLKKEFIEYMTNAFHDKKIIKSKKRELNNYFNIISKFMFDEKDAEKELSNKKMFKLASNIAILFKYLDFVKDDRLINYLNSNGIVIDKSSSTSLANEFNLNHETSDNLSSIFNDVLNAKKSKINEIDDKIKNIYEENFDEESEIKFSTFSKLAKGKFLSLKDEEKFDKFKEKTIENSIIRATQEEFIQNGLNNI